MCGSGDMCGDICTDGDMCSDDAELFQNVYCQIKTSHKSQQ